MELPVSVDAAELCKQLRQRRQTDIEGWTLVADESLIWLVNPYGIDVGFYSHDLDGCRRILARIMSDDREAEWGML